MMRKIITITAFALLVFTVMATDVFTGELENSIEHKKAAIMKIMNQGQFKPFIQDDAKFCAVFLEAFKQQKNIEHIKPIVEVDDYNDPKLQDYLKQCPKIDFHKTYYIYHPTGMQEIAEKEATDKELTDKDWEDTGGIEFHATKNFKLYKVNIDNNAKNGDEYVFYAEGYRNVVTNRIAGSYSGYRAINPNNCKRIGSVSTTDPFDYEKQKPIENSNGIIQHKNKYYVFELKDWGGTWFLFLVSYKNEIKNMNNICAYRNYQ